MNLHTLPSSTKRRKRVGRGTSAGGGKTAGRGTKGQKSRTGHHNMPTYFEGGQMPLTIRLPKLRGFRNPLGYQWASVTLTQLATSSLTEVSLATLKKADLVPRPARFLKVIGNQPLKQKLIVTADRITPAARRAIEAAGGTVTVTAKPSVKNESINQTTLADTTNPEAASPPTTNA